MADDLAEKVLSGALKPGQRLPTEAELCEQYEVSRTVVREAIARLRSDGLLLSHQGRGMFVSDRPPARKFEIDHRSFESLPETISILELRLGVEVEAAALCATRRSTRDLADIRAQLAHADALQSKPETVEIHYDFSFHLSIARGAHNPFFYSFLKFLEPVIVPRFRLGDLITPEMRDRYFARINDEHQAVVRAIEDQDPDAARDAMRLHLRNSLDRLRALARAAGVDAGVDTKGALPESDMVDFMKTLLRDAPVSGA